MICLIMQKWFAQFHVLLLAVGLMWLTACANGSENGPSSGQPTLTTPTAVSFPTRKVELAEEVVVTVTMEPGQERVPTIILPRELLDEEKIATTAHFDLYADDGYFPVPLDVWQTQVEDIYDDVSAQLGATSNQRIELTFNRPIEQSCPARGITILEDPPQMVIFADAETSQDQLQGVLAHEIGHVLLHHGFDPPLSSNRALNEGLATWAAQQYWNDWQGWPSLAVAVQSFTEEGTYLPLYENEDLSAVYLGASRLGEECLKYRDILYTEWAAFQDYLIQEHGMDSLITLFESAIPEVEGNDDGTEVIYITSPDYQAVYGQALNQLEANWLRSLAGGE